MFRLLLILHFYSAVYAAEGYFEGDDCRVRGEPGNCTYFEDCQNAQDALREGKRPKRCSWSGGFEIVCCSYKRYAPRSTTTLKPTTFNPPIKPVHRRGEDVCPELDRNLTAPRTGSKAWNKCIEYQAQYVYPCGNKVVMMGGKVRHNECHHAITPVIVGGEDAADHEFPHMVALGYLHVKTGWKPQWRAGGSLISENFVLTAAHCTWTQDYEDVKFIRAEAHLLSSPYAEHQMGAVEKIIKHPDYKSPSKYHDMALLKLRKPMKLSSTMVPACLDVKLGVDYNKAIVIGWGSRRYGGGSDFSLSLQKVTLNEFSEADCKTWYPRKHMMEQGYQHQSQMCYGADNKDACQGDSGGPMQARNSLLSCMYTVIGITSLGSGCGIAPGVYTRVAPAVPWIESVVWPDSPETEQVSIFKRDNTKKTNQSLRAK